MRRFRVFWLLCCCAASLPARREPAVCGTSAETPAERLFLHRQQERARRTPRPLAPAPAPHDRDIGQIAIVEDRDGIVARPNEFNLDGQTLRFTPSGLGYRYSVEDGGYDASAAAGAAPVAALDDDDSRLVPLPFAFPFFGAIYREFHLNSDGNLTFAAPDTASTDRSLGRMTAGPPRVSPLFDDLNPAAQAGGVRVLTEPGRVVVSWVDVPEWAPSGTGPRQTFQVSIYPDGRIAFSYAGVRPSSAVVGIAPGSGKGSTTMVDYRSDASAVFTAVVAERFGTDLNIDIVTLAQRFYQTHDDAYDYLVVFNNMDVPALTPGVLAYESTVRSRGAGYGVPPRDDGAQHGSASRLKAVLNMGPMSQYPKDPDALVPARASAGDTPLTVIAHEAGHLFLAYASVPDPKDPASKPMLDPPGQHWSFLFNSEASLLEGERIEDKGAGASPRFVTTATAEGYSPLDQYLMGWRAASEVPESLFYVAGAPPQYRFFKPLRGFGFDGERRDVAVGDLVRAMGRRTPDHTIAQRRFRFAFVVVTAPGADPSPADLAQMEQYRQRFESYFAKASGQRAYADAALRRSLTLSLYPAAGVAVGSTATATLSVTNAPASNLAVAMQAAGAAARFPASVTIPAGAVSASFSIAGVAAGVEDVLAVPADPAYETAFARVQVAGAAELKLAEVSADPPAVRLTDANGLVYAGVRVLASASAGATITPPSALTDPQGLAVFRWTPAPNGASQAHFTVEGIPGVSLTLRAGPSVPAIAAVVNAASFVPGVAAGALQTIFGANLGGARLSLDGVALPVSFSSDKQINFYVPAETRTGPATLEVTTPSGDRASRTVEVAAAQPGIFGFRSRDDGYLEIYCTGLGPTTVGADGLARTAATPVVFIGATPVQPLFSGLTPYTPGLYQINLRVPQAASSGDPVLVSVSLARSNQVPLP